MTCVSKTIVTTWHAALHWKGGMLLSMRMNSNMQRSSCSIVLQPEVGPDVKLHQLRERLCLPIQVYTCLQRVATAANCAMRQPRRLKSNHFSQPVKQQPAVVRSAAAFSLVCMTPMQRGGHNRTSVWLYHTQPCCVFRSPTDSAVSVRQLHVMHSCAELCVVVQDSRFDCDMPDAVSCDQFLFPLTFGISHFKSLQAWTFDHWLLLDCTALDLKLMEAAACFNYCYLKSKGVISTLHVSQELA